MSGSIFVSYRRGDSSHAAGRIASDLGKEFGEKAVFLDVSVIGLGEKWPEELERALRDARVMVAVISPDWVGKDPNGHLRIQEEEDWVRREIEVALALEKTILPVFVDNAKALKKEDLPESLAAFLKYQAKTLHHRSWVNDLDQVVCSIETLLGPRAARRRIPPHGPTMLPVSLNRLRSRETELRRLDEAWDSEQTKILSIVAWGGVGKSALVAHWRALLKVDPERAPDVVFEWSFHKQGKSDEEASADDFFDSALRHFESDEDPGRLTSPWDRGQRLAELVGRYNTLLILDGVEPLQSPLGSYAGAHLKDDALKALIEGLAAVNRGLCVITTRARLIDLGGREQSFAPCLELERLGPEAGAALLQDLGVRGSEEDLRTAANEFGGHALALTLLGGYLKQASDDHDVRRWREVPLLEQDDESGGQARRVLESYEQWLSGPRREPMLAILRLMGLFDRPADSDSIKSLLARPPIADLTDSIVGLKQSAWNRSLSQLEQLHLLTRSKDVDGPTLDVHPLVRQYYAAQIAERPEAAREAHRRLFEHLSKQAPDRPETLKEMMPLLFAVAHGCRAGAYQEALNVYWNRCRRGNERFLGRELGAIGAELVALRNFIPGEEPVEHFSLCWNARLLETVALGLWSLGRTEEASLPGEAALRVAKSAQDWLTAAKQSANLSEFAISLGKLRKAIEHGEEGVDLARRSGNTFLLIGNIATLTKALHGAGEMVLALQQFDHAEQLWVNLVATEDDFINDFAYCDVSEFSFCDLLLSERRYDDVVSRCRKIIDDRKPYHGDLYIASARLSLARAYHSRGNADESEVLKHVEDALSELERSGVHQFLTQCLVFLAELKGDRDPSEGYRSLLRVATIAGRDAMRLVQVDILLQTARFELSGKLDPGQRQEIVARVTGQRERPAEARDKPPAIQALRKARELIEKTGYRLRQRDLESLEQKAN